MMFERLTPEARAVVFDAREQAGRFGHRYIGGEHLLRAVVATDQPASHVLRDHGITPDSVDEHIVRLVGLGAGAGLLSALDRDALAAIGIDLDTVRARIEASFDPAALVHAAQTVARGPSRRRPCPGLAAAFVRRRRRPAPTTARPSAPAGGFPSTGSGPRGYLPFAPRAKKALEDSWREALAQHDRHVGVEHLALAVLASKGGTVPAVLSALGASPPRLRTAILDRSRAAS